MTPYNIRSIDLSDSPLEGAYAPLLSRLLVLRGIVSREEAERFLAPDWERDTHDPFRMKDMDRACERIARAMHDGETIAIWSDYDMDGIPGAVVLWDLFRALGYERVIHHTPHRNKDGFGLNQEGLTELREQGAALVITVDCGIGDVACVAFANELGLDMIVTDHHIPHDELPAACAILNPKQPGCEYPEKMLCGAGVAFKLTQALTTHLHRGSARAANSKLPTPDSLKWLLDMAGMATIADMVPLRGENRTLAHFGLIVLRKSRRPGLQALLRKARADQRYLTEDDIGFTIAPRVNAASRMGHASQAFALLSTHDPLEAGTLADELDRINTERKTLVATMKREIKRRIEAIGEPKEVIVMGNPEWKPSLLGLVAGGLAEEYARPVFLWGREESTVIKGSCRSDGRVSVFAVMQQAREHFIEYGGHAYSGGFSVEHERVHALEAALIDAHRAVAQEASDVEHTVDAELSLDDVTWETYRTVKALAPFGEGNPKPRFLFRSVLPISVRTFGKGSEHLEVVFRRSDGSEVKAIAFFSSGTSFHTPLAADASVSIVAYLEENNFRNAHELRLRLIDVVAA